MQKQDILNYLKSNQEYYHNQFGIKFIGLFGSFARDEATDSSDIDILYKIEKDKIKIGTGTIKFKVVSNK